MNDKKEENSYCSKCREKTNNDRIRGILMQNKVAIQKSRCSICDSRKSAFLKLKSGSKMLKTKIYR